MIGRNTRWLRMLVAADEALADPARVRWQEAKELNLIFSAILRNMDGRQ